MNTRVICNLCDGESVVDLDNDNKLVTWKRIEKIISARFRFDGQWGFQCYCGNNSLMSDKEIDQIENPVLPTAKEIEDIKNDLIAIEDKRFRLVAM